MENLVQHPALECLGPARRADVIAHSHLVALEAGDRVFAHSQDCKGLPLLLEGEIRVQMTGVSGNEIVLYRVQAGDLCTLTVSCLLAATQYTAEAIVERPGTALLIPAKRFHELMDEVPGFRRIVLQSYSERLQSLMLVIEEVAFRRLDQRLAERLLARQRNGALAATHHDLAVELGTAREVVSRLLKEFERNRLVHLGRGLITLTDTTGLSGLAGHAQSRATG